MGSPLHAKLTRCRHEMPLAEVDGLPGPGAALRPEQLRQLAAALLRIAADCEGRLTKGKKHIASSRKYPLAPD